VANDRKFRIVTERDDLLVDHKSKDTHHGSTAVIELNGALLQLFFLAEVLPSEVNVSVTEVTDELVASSLNIAHERTFEESNEGNELDESSSGDGVRSNKGGNTVGVRVEGVSRIVNGSWEVESSTGGDLSQEGKLGWRGKKSSSVSNVP
jgi:hypothetical protein